MVGNFIVCYDWEFYNNPIEGIKKSNNKKEKKNKESPPISIYVHSMAMQIIWYNYCTPRQTRVKDLHIQREIENRNGK